MLFSAPDGQQSQAQIEAFDDTWHWDHAAASAFEEVWRGSHSEASIFLKAMRDALGENDMMAYLSMMAVRLIELHRVLKLTGSLYLHCDSTASHYLKILLDAIFGIEQFRNEIIWKRSHAHSDGRQGAQHFGRTSDTILFYTKSSRWFFNPQYTPYDQSYIDRDYRRVDADGRRYRLDNIQGPGGAANGNPIYEVMGVRRYWRYSQERMEQLITEGRIMQTRPGAVPQYKRYLDEMPGVPLQNIWTDMPGINNRSEEYLGYPTQKPVALLERIITSSSNAGEIVLDPFCGCGTTIHAAQRLGRQWLGIDVTHLAIALIEKRMKEKFPGIVYEVHGVPKDADAAARLARDNPHEFQTWIVATIGGQPYRGGRRGMDRGIDGYLHFRDAERNAQTAIISVKGGATNSGHVRDLKGTMERENAVMGIFLTLNPPTREMTREAAAAGFFHTGGRQFPKVQILTAAEVIANRRPQVPFGFTESLRRAATETGGDRQGQLL